ncbi:MAG: cupin domain-containing protein [Thermoleophilia bacterium]
MAAGDTHRHARREDAEAVFLNGALVTILTPGAWSGGGFSLVEVLMPAGRATPLHTDESDETLHVIEGAIRVHVDGDEVRAGPGDQIAVRRLVPHAFLADGGRARVLCLNFPRAHDGFFREAGTPAVVRDLAAAPPPDPVRMRAAAARHGVTILGPPPFR